MTAEVVAAVAEAHRRDWARVLAATAHLTRDLDLAEECTQDAYAQALQTWPRDRHPGPARRVAHDDRPATGRATCCAASRCCAARCRCWWPRSRSPVPRTASSTTTGCGWSSPAATRRSPRDAQVALTLRLVCGLSTTGGGPRLPGRRRRPWPRGSPGPRRRSPRPGSRTACPRRTSSPSGSAPSSSVVHLIFTTGHTAPVGAHLVREDLVDSAIGLARMLHLLMPADAEVSGAARAACCSSTPDAATRVGPDGRLVLLAEQDRTRWDAARRSRRASRCSPTRLRRRPPTRYAVEAAIAAVHAEAPSWAGHRLGRDRRRCTTSCCGCGPPRSSSSTAPSRRAARRPAGRPATRWRRCSTSRRWPPTRYLSAARADFLRRLDRWRRRPPAYEEALALTDNDVERAFLADRLDEVRAHLPT